MARTEGGEPAVVPRPRLVVALMAGVLAIAGSFAVGGRTPAFVVAPVGSLVASLMPGAAMSVAILGLGDLAQPLAFSFALGLTLTAFAGIARLALVAGERSRVPFTAAVAGFVGSLVLSILLVGRPGLSVAAAGPVAAVLAAAEWRWKLTRRRPTQAERRSVLRAASGVVALTGASVLRGWTITGARSGPLRLVLDEELEREAEELVADAREGDLDVSGLEGPVSDDFYEVDINTVDPNPTAERWSLRVTGAVEEELTLDYEDLLDRPMEHRFNTLRCVGERLNGKKMDNALWTGVPISALLEAAGPQSGCECVMLRAVDGYYEEFPLAALRPGLLAVGMNGRVLPRQHGYPVRALVPGHWGEVSVKWLTEVEVLDQEATGYWEEKGWQGTGPVNPVAKIHAVEHHDDGRVTVGGHAYAGSPSVDRVEVSVDDGDSWATARLSPQLPEADTWRQWAYTFEPTRSEHEVVARVVDGDGAVQPEGYSGAYPSGPSGWVSRTVKR